MAYRLREAPKVLQEATFHHRAFFVVVLVVAHQPARRHAHVARDVIEILQGHRLALVDDVADPLVFARCPVFAGRHVLRELPLRAMPTRP